MEMMRESLAAGAREGKIIVQNVPPNMHASTES